MRVAEVIWFSALADGGLAWAPDQSERGQSSAHKGEMWRLPGKSAEFSNVFRRFQTLVNAPKGGDGRGIARIFSSVSMV